MTRTHHYPVEASPMIPPLDRQRQQKDRLVSLGPWAIRREALIDG